MQSQSIQKIARPSDCILVIKQDYQFLLDSDSPFYGSPFKPLTAIVITFSNSSSPQTKMEVVVEAFDVSYKVVSSNKAQQVERTFKTSPEMGHLMPRDQKDASWALQHQFWIRLNKTTNKAVFHVGDVCPYTKPLFDEKINPWDLPKKELERHAHQEAGQKQGSVGKYEFEFNVVKISYFEGRHTTTQPFWVKWKLYENNSKPLPPVLKEPGNFYSEEESAPIIDYPHGIQHLYAMCKNKNLRDLAFMAKSSKINQSWEDVPAAIHFSITTKQGKHYNRKPVGILNHLFRLKNHWDFHEIETQGRSAEDVMKQITEKRRAYIRFQTLAPDGDAPGSKMVLQIWPPYCCSIIHNHGEAFGVVKPLSGSIRVQNFHRLGFGGDNPFAEFTYHSGSFTWMSEHSYGVHRLVNSFRQTCITIQSYLNGENTAGTFSVVGKGKFNFGQDEFLGQYTPQNDWQNYIKGLTAETQEDRRFLADVIDAYGLKENGSLDLSFRKFCHVMRAEYENLNTMFDNIKYEGPTLKDNVNNMFGNSVVGSVRSAIKGRAPSSVTKPSNKTSDDVQEAQILLKNKLYEQAADVLIQTNDVRGVEDMVKNYRKSGKGAEIAELALKLWENGGDRLVMQAFMIDQTDNMKIGGESGKKWLYLGSLRNGKRDGKGKTVWTNGTQYEGEWRNDERDGNGVYSSPNGGLYDGGWSRDMKNGKGTYIYPESGDRYQGQFRNNAKDGQGTYIYSDGSKYVGEWKNDMKHGRGVYQMGNQDRFEGTWENDAIHGKGTHFYANGKSKVKQYRHGKKV